jgi:hypothetical protein
VLTYALPISVKDALTLAGIQAAIEIGPFTSFGVSELTDLTEQSYGRLERVGFGL